MEISLLVFENRGRKSSLTCDFRLKVGLIQRPSQLILIA